MAQTSTVYDNILVPLAQRGARLLIAMEGECHWESYTYYWTCHKTFYLEVDGKKAKITEKQAWDLFRASGFLKIPIWDCPITAKGTINCRF